MNVVQWIATTSFVPASPLDPAGPSGARMTSILFIVMWTSFIVGGAVFLGLIFTFFKFRAKKGDTSEGAQWHEKPVLEALYTIFPFILFMVLFGIGAANVNYISNGPGNNSGAPTFNDVVIAHQFFWEYEYKDITLPNGQHPYTFEQLNIPVNSVVNMNVISLPTPPEYPTGVNHSFYVPELAAQINAIPGQTNFTWMEASTAGMYYGQCTELCGTGHDQMLITVDAMTQQQYSQWAASCKSNATFSPGYKVYVCAPAA